MVGSQIDHIRTTSRVEGRWLFGLLLGGLVMHRSGDLGAKLDGDPRQLGRDSRTVESHLQQILLARHCRVGIEGYRVGLLEALNALVELLYLAQQAQEQLLVHRGSRCVRVVGRGHERKLSAGTARCCAAWCAGTKVGWVALKQP